MPPEDDDMGFSSEEEFRNCLESKIIRKHVIKGEDDEPDEFENEMEKELDAFMCNLEKQNALRGVEPCSSSEGVPKKVIEKNYNEIYFDSDEEELPAKPRKRHKVLSNDELFYDPNADDDDQNWVDDVRRSYQPKHSNGKGKPALPKSDAILSCPCCMTTLCRDCQRHEIYTSQFRAMFVMNCNIDFSKKLIYTMNAENEARGKKNKKKKNKKQPQETSEIVERITWTSDAGGLDVEEIYFGVKCAVCKVEVGVYDTDEVYHFFGVLAN